MYVQFGETLIEKPLIYVFTKIPLFRDNWEKGKKEYKAIIHGKNGLNVGFAFSSMFVSTIWLAVSILAVSSYFFEIKVRENSSYYAITVLVFSYIVNQFLLYKSDKYKLYFKEFERKRSNVAVTFLGVLFHLVIWTWGLLSIYLADGFG
jgi:hypothetical protein